MSELQRICAPVAVRYYSPEEDDTETVAYFPLLDGAVRWVTALMDAGWLERGDWYAQHEDGRRVMLVIQGHEGRSAVSYEERVLIETLVERVLADPHSREEEAKLALRLCDEFGWRS